MQATIELNNEQVTEPHGRRRRRALLLAPFALIMALAVPYFTINDEPDRLDAAARQGAPGSFVRLSAGYTYYELAGPEDGHPVVLVHGVTIPSFVWDHNFEALGEAGWRAVRYDLYGRGLSDRPEASYDLDFYVRQLSELLAQVAPGKPVDLVGLSMGGMIVSEFALRQPDQVRKLVLFDPAGVGTKMPLAAKVAVLPGAGEYLMRVAGTRYLLSGSRYLLHPDRYPDFDSTHRKTIRFQGSRRAVLESVRKMPINQYEAGYRELGALGKPILLVWGHHDTIIPFSTSERVRELVRPTTFVAVEEAGHLPNYERPDVVNAALLDFLAK
ncbi:MAG: alpha/beta hydrolase [Chloroflexota bacterium]|nr:alpha/beta hydrolase [Chloroflexota bacterium]